MSYFPIKVFVLATNSEGSPEFYRFEMNVSQYEYDEGLHYNVAKLKAEEHGFEDPMIAFDERDQAAKQLADLLSVVEDEPETPRP